MIKRPIARRLAAVAAIALAAGVAVPGTASAQQDSGWLWGGAMNPGGSGREMVRFSTQFAPGQIVVSFGDRRLYHVVRPGEAVSYPIAIPREQSRWQGVTAVSMKRENPSWTPTPTMRAENPRLPNWVPGGHPLNPLGVRALYLGSSTYRIHGTDAPWTIGSAVSKGCIRMYNQDVLDLYPRVAVGTKVTVTWQTFRGGPVTSGPADQPRQTGRPAKKRVAAVETPPSAFDDEERPAPRRVTTAAAPGQKKPIAKRAAPRVRSAEVTE